MSENELAIVANQIQGIMDCTDMMNIAYLVKNKQLYMINKQRLICLLRIHNKTQQHLMDKYHQLIQIKNTFTRIDGDIDIIVSNAMRAWIKWANVAIELYSKEEGNWWKYLLHLHQKDLKAAECCVKKCKIDITEPETKQVVEQPKPEKTK